ncbi:hypothetical protein [Streptomyces cuspidosporus]|uniref:Uncharacterized protein n=1 Tax=Streptomyces cuspidosporus TaxID=66882 RepID=A0ABN3GFI7_9ACTN
MEEAADVAERLLLDEVPSELLPPVSIDESNTRLLVDEGYYTEAELGQ